MNDLGPLIYKEDLERNEKLKSDRFSNKLGIASTVLVLIGALLTFLSVKTTWRDMCVIFLIISASIMLLIFKYCLDRIKPLEVYEYGFLYPYCDGPRDRKVFWNDIYVVVHNVRGMPGYVYFVLKNGRILLLRKYTVSDLEKFLSLMRAKGVRVEEREMSVREIKKIRKDIRGMIM